MTFRQIEFYVTACQEGSFGKAAAKLLISQQSISKAVQELESELGVTLLERHASGLSFTSYGAFVYEEFLRILQEKSNLICLVQDMKAFPKESLTVGMSFGVISALPPTFLKDFERAFPYIQLNYEDHPDSELLRRFRNENYDFILTIGPVDSKDTLTELIHQEPVFLCIPKDHPLYSRSLPVTMEELRQYSFVMFDHQFRIRDNFFSACNHAGFEPDIYLSSGDFNSLLELCANTNNLFIVPQHTVRESRTIRYEPFPDARLTWDVLFAIKKSKVFSPCISSFHSFLLESLHQGGLT